ncbi:MerR family transcriptional regulator OS=Streptomyces tendae OX=1932 GN=GUR47_13695 PE=4 SV=1 [Streptomyces tendae]
MECLRAGHPEGDSCPASLVVYRRKLAELDTLIEQLTAVRAQVAAQLTRAKAAAPGGPEPKCELGGHG